jgi:aminoglycoside phosphotransferase (APT) family kinase protein
MTRSPGELIARGTRSVVRAYGAGAVIKVPDASTAESWIGFEARYAEAARACGAPVPRLLGIERVDGRPASVWERVEGVSIWQLVVDAPQRGVELGRALADVHLALFELVPPVTLPSQRDRLSTKIRRVAATVDAGLARALDALPPVTRGPALCHGDLHPSNVLLGQAGPMIVDWFDASRGDAVADVARASLMLLGNETQPPAHLPGAEPATLATLHSSYLAHLSDRLGIDSALLDRWQAVNAVARMAEEGVARGPLADVWVRFERARARDQPPEDVILQWD